VVFFCRGGSYEESNLATKSLGSQHCSALLAAARSQNGSGVINTIHYRSAASLPVESLQDGANSRTKSRRLDARGVFYPENRICQSRKSPSGITHSGGVFLYILYTFLTYILGRKYMDKF